MTGAALPDGEAHARSDACTRDERSVELLRQAAACADPTERSALHEMVFVLNTHLGQRFASRYRGRGVEWEDLLQVAYVGLVKAVQGFQAADHNSFAAYAAPTITGEIKRYFRDHAWSVRPPRRIQELQAAMRPVEAELQQALGRAPTARELADALHVEEAAVTEALAAGSSFAPVSLDAPMRDGSANVADLLPDPHDPYDRVEQFESLSPALAELSDREQQVVLLRFVYRYTQDRIGREIGVSQMQVSRLLRGVLRKLRLHLDEPPESVAEQR